MVERSEVPAAARWGAGLVIATLAAGYVVLVTAVLSPRTFFSGDAGVKYLQADALVRSGWRALAIPNPAPALDPHQRFSVLALNQFERRAPEAPFYGAYSVLFALPVSVGLWAFGVRGLYVIPVAATVLTLIITYRLAARTAPRSSWLAPLLAGAASPLAFYSVDLWEHSLATLCAAGAVLLMLDRRRSMVRRSAGAGVLLGVAINLREELLAILPVGALLLLWLGPRRHALRAGAVAIGALVALVPHWLLRALTSGQPVRRAVTRIASTLQLAAPPPSMPLMGPVTLLFPPAWIAVLAPALALRVVAARWRRWQRPALGGVAVAIAGLAAANAVHLVRTWSRPDALLAAFPPALLVLLWPPRRGPGDRAWRESASLTALAGGFAVIAALLAPLGAAGIPIGGSQFGPRFLLPIVPLLAVGVTFVVDRRNDWAAHGLAPRVVAGIAAIVVAAGIGVQAQGLRDLRGAKAGYESLARAVETIPAGQPVVTDIWWYATVVAPVLRAHQTVGVEASADVGSTEELLASPALTGVGALTLVASADQRSSAARAFATAGWRETRRRTVAMWRPLALIELVRPSTDAERGGGNR